MTPAPAGAPGVDLDALAQWLRQRLGAGSVTDIASVTGGTQNRLVRFRFAGRALVVRLPPVAKRADSDDAMRREARVLAALSTSGVPHPALVAAEPTLEPLGCAFLVMEAVDGLPAAGRLQGPYGDDAIWRRAIGTSMAASIARLGELDPARIGLAGLGRPGSFLARQPQRWRRQLDSYASGGIDGYEPLDPDAVERLHGWLDANRSPDQRPGLLHGDVHCGNVLLARHTPGLAAVVDWELATVGDPLLDLGQLLVTWPDRSGRSALGPVASLAPPEGLATETELVESYASATTRDLSHLAWYKVLAAFRLAALVEGTWARACAGHADLATGRRLRTAASVLLRRADRERAEA